MKQNLTYILLVLLFAGLGIGGKELYMRYQLDKSQEESEALANNEVDYTIGAGEFYDSLKVLTQVKLEDPEISSKEQKSTSISEAISEDSTSRSESKPLNKSVTTVEREGSLYKKPFYIISVSAVSKKESAIKGALKIQKEKIEGNFLWIPDYDPNGKKLYKVYIGPFKNKLDASKEKERVSSLFPGCYVQTIK